jgi:Rieske 2Fe-2S family protein
MIERMLQALRARRPDHTLDGFFYNDPAVFDLDLQAIFHRHWIFACATCELAEPGDYITLTIGRTPVIVLRDRDGVLRGFFNSCRHRGARILDAPRGRVRTLVCPYHLWTYRLTGELAHARYMGEDFDVSGHGLTPVHVRTVAGTVYACLAETPPDFDAFAAALTPLLAPHNLEGAKLAAEFDLLEAGNWKLVMENSRECYHCANQHKELMQSFLDLYDFRDPGAVAEVSAYWDACEAAGLPSHIAEGPDFRGSRLPFLRGARSITMDGAPAVARGLGLQVAEAYGSLRWVKYPTTFNHALPDYAVLVRMLPVGPEQTLVTTKFLVDASAVEGRDYDLATLTHVWNTTNDQDRALVERNQAGVNSFGYRPGPYAPGVEAGIIKFVDWYCGEIAAFGTAQR